MREIADLYRRRADAFEALIANVPPDRWASQSPCEEWLARDVVAHVVGYSAYELRESAGVEPTPAPSPIEDPAAAFRAIRADVERVLEDPATPPDVLRHIDLIMDPEEVKALWEALSAMGPSFWEWQVENGYYAPKVAVSEDAPLQDRVVGLVGRDPNWSPPTS